MTDLMTTWCTAFNNAILRHEWPNVPSHLKVHRFDFDIPDDLRMAILSLFPDRYLTITSETLLNDYTGDSTIYELLTGTSKYNYSVAEGRNLVK